MVHGGPGRLGQRMKFQAEEVAMEMLIEIGPLLEELKRRDRELAMLWRLTHAL